MEGLQFTPGIAMCAIARMSQRHRLKTGGFSMKWSMLAAAAAAFVSFGAADALAGRDLDQIKARNTLRCGVQGPSNPGFGVPDSQGRWGGFNVEVCRAIAITIFGDPNRVEFVPVTTQSRFPALSSGEVDVLSNNTTWTLTRDTNVNRFNFPAITFSTPVTISRMRKARPSVLHTLWMCGSAYAARNSMAS
jgi:ABC-type amino acid transport substrate-binding protein